MSENSPEPFLSSYHEVETAYLAAKISDKAPTALPMLRLMVSMYGPDDDLSEFQTGYLSLAPEETETIKQEVIDSLAHVTGFTTEYPHVAVAAYGLLNVLRPDHDQN